MVSDSIMNASIPAAAKDFNKKKRVTLSLSLSLSLPSLSFSL
ncbi:hypothetical protein RJ641_009236 [Dillenia turbinata]|uniref:Uncharacterized protein n=1 Tax=Dillenia turbinata TaxID=194707 RepID=A0AAN8UZN8_9MAGN